MINFNKDDFLKLSDKDRMIHIEPIDIPHLTAADIGYESPIAIDHMVENIVEETETEIDKLTYKAIMKVGVRVDKEELIKALAYDRNQYTKGFNDGLKRSRASWVGIDDFPHEYYECNRCGYAHITDDISIFKYCPHCGAMMMGQEAAEMEQNDAD